MKMDSVHGTVNGRNVVTSSIRRDYFSVFTLRCLSKKKFPFTYFHLLVLHLPIGNLIFTLQDFKTTRAKHFAVFKTQYIDFFVLY